MIPSPPLGGAGEFGVKSDREARGLVRACGGFQALLHLTLLSFTFRIILCGLDPKNWRMTSENRDNCDEIIIKLRGPKIR